MAIVKAPARVAADLRTRVVAFLEAGLAHDPQAAVTGALELLRVAGYRAPSRSVLWWAVTRDAHPAFPAAHWQVAGRAAIALLKSERQLPISIVFEASSPEQTEHWRRELRAAAAYLSETHLVSVEPSFVVETPARTGGEG